MAVRDVAATLNTTDKTGIQLANAGGRAASPGPSIDELCINTIRTLVDGRRAAGRIPAIPARRWRWRRWSIRCGSASCASIREDPDLAKPRPLRAVQRTRLDAALCDAASHRRKGGQRRVRASRRARGHARRHQTVPPDRQQVSGPSRISPDRRASRRRPARWAKAARRASAWRSPERWLAQHFNRPGFHDLRLRRLRDVRRRRHDGGRDQRSRLARGPPDARQPLLDLRQQPHDDRRPHRSRLQRRRRGALPCLWLERAAGRRRQRHGADRAGDRDIPPHQRTCPR